MTPDTQQLIDTARRLWSGAFEGLLSTHSDAHPGYPFGSVAPYGLSRDGYPLMLLSHLAQHSKNLLHDSRCGLLVSETGNGDSQQRARLSVIADCLPLDTLSADERQRFFRYFPHMQAYFEQLNFRFFQISPRHFHLNAGFAAARWLGKDRILQTAGITPTEEQELIDQWSDRVAGQRHYFSAEINQDLSTRQQPIAVEIAGIDCSGIDLRAEEYLQRVAFSETAGTASAVNAQLSRLMRQAG